MSNFRIILFLFLLVRSSFSFESNPKEFAEIFSLILSQSKNYHEKILIGIKGSNYRRVKRLTKEIAEIGFIMNRSRPVELGVEQFSPNNDENYDVIVYFPHEKILENSSSLSIAMSKRQVILGASVGILFMNSRPKIFVNSRSLKKLSYDFEDAFLRVAKDMGGKL